MDSQIIFDRAEILNSAFSTQRLVIEPLFSYHADLLFESMQNEKIYDWISSRPPESFDHLKLYWKKLESRLSQNKDEAWLNWVVRRASDGAYIGKLDADINIENIATNIGYLFFPDYWGNGYASESVIGLTKHLANNSITKMFATVTLGNEASYRVLEKSGYKRNRIIPDNDTIRGVKFDDVEYVWCSYF